MSQFRAIVQEEVQKAKTSQAVQGYIPPNGLDPVRRLATVRVPSQHFGMQPGAGASGLSYLEYLGVPCPSGPAGFLEAFQNHVLDKEIGVIVAYKGGHHDFPYIVNFIEPAHALRERELYRVDGSRNPNLFDRFLTGLAPAAKAAGGALGNLVPPGNPLEGTPLAPLGEAFQKAVGSGESLLNSHQPFLGGLRAGLQFFGVGK